MILMARYKIHIDQKKITDEEIEKTKDFRKVVYRYQHGTRRISRFPLYKFKNRKWWMAILIILLLIFLMIEFA